MRAKNYSNSVLFMPTALGGVLSNAAVHPSLCPNWPSHATSGLDAAGIDVDSP